MNFATVEKIADAVLYEGYILYPYRPSSIKNQQRWNFGTLFPFAFADAQKPPETSSFRAEILLEGGPESVIDVRVRFLQTVPVDAGDRKSWDEGFTRSKTLEGITVAAVCEGVEREFDFSALAADEVKRAPASYVERPCIGRFTLRAERLSDGLYRLSATFANLTPVDDPEQTSRKTAQATAFTSAHLLLHVAAGSFVSLLDPPPEFALEAATCSNQGVFPVLVGDEGDRNLVLCAPIILYDYPQVAPESAGDFFDGTEMDEMLALRVMTLTDEEKDEMRRSDPHARAILERTETLPKEQLLKVHGAVRGMRPAESNEADAIDGAILPWGPFDEHPPVESVVVFGVELRKGDRVRLWPQKKADIMDMAMEGKVALIESIEQDLEDNLQFAVVLEDDPGKDMGMLRQAGHRFFFSPEEVEPLGLEAS